MRTLPLLCLLAACAPAAPIADAAEALPACPQDTRNWTAWVNAMPGPGSDPRPTLVVTGEVLLPEGSNVTITAGGLDRMQPPAQRVTIALIEGEATAGWNPIRIDIGPALMAYREVIVGCDGTTVARIAPVEVAY